VRLSGGILVVPALVRGAQSHAVARSSPRHACAEPPPPRPPERLAHKPRE